MIWIEEAHGLSRFLYPLSPCLNSMPNSRPTFPNIHLHARFLRSFVLMTGLTVHKQSNVAYMVRARRHFAKLGSSVQIEMTLGMDSIESAVFFFFLARLFASSLESLPPSDGCRWVDTVFNSEVATSPDSLPIGTSGFLTLIFSSDARRRFTRSRIDQLASCGCHRAPYLYAWPPAHRGRGGTCHPLENWNLFFEQELFGFEKNFFVFAPPHGK